MKFWVSWWSGYYEDEGCTAPSFQIFISGYRDRGTDDGRDECSICAWVQAESEEAVIAVIAEHFPDYEMRFCSPVEDEWKPNNRFPGATLQTIGQTT
jgi:hypothetical protein